MSVDTITIRLAGAPQGKGRARSVIRKSAAKGSFIGNYTPEKTRTYEAALRHAASEVMGGRPPIEGPVAVRVIAAQPIPESWSAKKRRLAQLGTLRPGKPDWDNLAKVCDALNEIVWRDDKQVAEGAISKVYSEVPCLTVVVVPLAQPALATALVEEGKGAGLVGVGTALLHPRPFS